MQLAKTTSNNNVSLSSSKSIEIYNISCIDCHKYNRPKFEKLKSQLTEYKNNYEAKCCAQNLTQLSVLLELVMSEENEELPPVANVDNFTMSLASMHKKLIGSNFEESQDKIYPFFDPFESYNLMFAMDEENPVLEHNRNIELFASGTKITVSGLYLVYSSVLFKPDSPEPCKTFAQQTFSLNISRTSSELHKEKDVLLSAVHTCCHECVRNQETGFTAGVFLLHNNDFLTVDVSGEGLVSYKPQTTYFGLVLLSRTK